MGRRSLGPHPTTTGDRRIFSAKSKVPRCDTILKHALVLHSALKCGHPLQIALYPLEHQWAVMRSPVRVDPT
jgi:hypothetical protein